MFAFIVGLIGIAVILVPLGAYFYFAAPMINKLLGYGLDTSSTLNEVRENMDPMDWVMSSFMSFLALCASILLVGITYAIGNSILDAIAARVN